MSAAWRGAAWRGAARLEGALSSTAAAESHLRGPPRARSGGLDSISLPLPRVQILVMRLDPVEVVVRNSELAVELLNSCGVLQ